MSADFLTWLTAWLRRHPVQSPPRDQGASYTTEVMARVGAPVPAPAFRWAVRPRTLWALATVTACGMALMVVQRTPSAAARMAADVQRTVDVLAAVGEIDPLSGAELEQDAVLMDQIMLAEAQDEAEDDLWIEDTLDLLNQVEEDAVAGSESSESVDELLHELELLDEHDIASS